MGRSEQIKIGISGWTFDAWRKGIFYPDKLAQSKELAYASSLFTSIEVNGTFYALQKPKTFANWYDETPAGFTFALKAPQYITHINRLTNVKDAVANFMLSGILCLEEKLGPILWQVPPSLAFEPEPIEDFFKLLPPMTGDIAHQREFASRWMKERWWFETKKSRQIRHAFEFRHESFMCEEFINLAKKYNIAIAVCDVAPGRPYLEEIGVADFIYIRLHGAESEYPKGYSPASLRKWAKKLTTWQKATEEIFVFCNCEQKTLAPANGVSLMKQVYGKKVVKDKEKNLLIKFSKPATNNRSVRKPNRRGRTKD